MKQVLFTTVSLGVLALVSPALGADLPTYSKAPAVASPVYDWSGYYVGVFGGGGYGNHNVGNANGNNGFANFTANYTAQGAVAGGEIGANWQSGNIVFGVEADGFWSGIKGNDTNQVIAGAFAVTGIDSTNLRDAASVRALGGVAVDRLLLFFDGGWAYGSFRHTNTDVTFGLGVDSFTATRSGLTAGGGIAYAITDSLIGKFEYRYFDFGRFTRAAPLNGALPYNVDSTYSVVTLGLDYKFNFGGPVVAKY
jgi:outer membrane immunogenic protein